MPNWLINIAIRLAIMFGIPYLAKLIPGLPKEIWAIIEEALNHLKQAQDKPAEVEKLRAAVKSCTGAGCSIDTVKDR